MNQLLRISFLFTILTAAAQNPVFTPETITVNGQKGCVVDMNGDYLDDIVGVSQTSVNIKYQQPDGTFISETHTTPSANFMPDWSIAAGDLNNDGLNDLLYGSSNGVTFMIRNTSGNQFTEISGPQYIFSQRSNFADLNGDSYLDAFVCHDIEPNVYYINDGAGGLQFNQGGLGDFPAGGNYGSIWVDYDNDGDSDLFIAKCRGGSSPAKIDELHRNNGNGTFTNVSVAAGMAEPSQSWSSAWGDYDNDGDMDAMIGVSSFSDGGHKLRRNNGNGTFTDVTAGSGFATFTGTSHEFVAHDFNNDGWIDILGPSSSGFTRSVMINNGNMTFTPVVISASAGPVCDLNDDGFLDIQNGNTVFFNNGNSNHYIKINLQGVESNRNGIGARIEVFTANGKQVRDVRSGDGFEYMSTITPHFGIGQVTEIDKVVVKWPSGTIDEILNPEIDQSLYVLEGSSLSIGENRNLPFSLFPVPASDFITIASDEIQIKNVDIFDLSGRKAQSSAIDENQTINVSQLASGSYIILLKTGDGKRYSQKFIKK